MANPTSVQIEKWVAGLLLSVVAPACLAGITELEAYTQVLLAWQVEIPPELRDRPMVLGKSVILTDESGPAMAYTLLGVSPAASAEANAGAVFGINRALATSSGFLAPYVDQDGAEQYVWGRSTAQSTWIDHWEVASDVPDKRFAEIVVNGVVEGNLAVTSPLSLPSHPATAYFSYQFMFDPNHQMVFSELLSYEGGQAGVSIPFSVTVFAPVGGTVSPFSRLIASTEVNAMSSFLGSAIVTSVAVEPGVSLVSASGLLVPRGGGYVYVAEVPEPASTTLFAVGLLMALWFGRGRLRGR